MAKNVKAFGAAMYAKTKLLGGKPRQKRSQRLSSELNEAKDLKASGASLCNPNLKEHFLIQRSLIFPALQVSFFASISEVSKARVPQVLAGSNLYSISRR